MSVNKCIYTFITKFVDLLYSVMTAPYKMFKLKEICCDICCVTCNDSYHNNICISTTLLLLFLITINIITTTLQGVELIK